MPRVILLALLLACLGLQAAFIYAFGGHGQQPNAHAGEQVLSIFSNFGVEPSGFLLFVLALGISVLVLLALWGAVYNPWQIVRLSKSVGWIPLA